MSFVLDASLTLAWCFQDEATEHTNAVLDAPEKTRALVPSLWFYEISNAVVTALRAGRTTEPKVKEFIRLLTELPIDVHPSPTHSSSFADSIREIATREKLSAYDASYVTLALELRLPLALVVQDLGRASRSEL